MMTRQSMVRVSSASPEADFAPAIQTPFDWEAAPGRAAARKSTKSGFSENFERDSDEVPSLPLPPGRRPKDGFYLPYSREFAESPEVQLESGGNCSKPRKLFNLKFPGSSKKPLRILQPFQSSSKPPEASHVNEDRGFSVFNPLSGQRLGSSITNRMIKQFQKKQSLWRRCLPSKPDRMNGSPSYIYPGRGRRLDEGFDEGSVTATDSPVSGPSLPSSPGHGHRPSSNCSPVQVNSSRFMASMLISLCPDDAGDSQLDAEDGNSDDDNDEIGIPHLTSPRTKSSSPEAFEVEMDPASQTVTSQEKWTCTCRERSSMLESSAPQRGKTSRSVSRSLLKELATASRSPSEHSRSGQPVPRSKNSVTHSMVGYLSPPRISIDDLEYTSNSGKPKAFARWRSTAAPSALRESSVEPGGSERKQSPVTQKTVSPLQKPALQRNTTPSKIRIKDLKQTAKSSSQRPTPAKAVHDTDASGEDSDCSTDSSGYETPPALSSHMLPNFASPKPASPKLLKPNLHNQRRNSPFMEDRETTLPGPSIQQIMMARSHSVRSSSTRRFAPQEFQADTNFRGPSHPSRLAKTSSSSVMSKVALFESKAGVSKSGPLSYTSSQ